MIYIRMAEVYKKCPLAQLVEHPIVNLARGHLYELREAAGSSPAWASILFGLLNDTIINYLGPGGCRLTSDSVNGDTEVVSHKQQLVLARMC